MRSLFSTSTRLLNYKRWYNTATEVVAEQRRHIYEQYRVSGDIYILFAIVTYDYCSISITWWWCRFRGIFLSAIVCGWVCCWSLEIGPQPAYYPVGILYFSPPALLFVVELSSFLLLIGFGNLLQGSGLMMNTKVCLSYFVRTAAVQINAAVCGRTRLTRKEFCSDDDDNNNDCDYYYHDDGSISSSSNRSSNIHFGLHDSSTYR